MYRQQDTYSKIAKWKDSCTHPLNAKKHIILQLEFIDTGLS
jgi:hypothetical protein